MVSVNFSRKIARGTAINRELFKHHTDLLHVKFRFRSINFATSEKAQVLFKSMKFRRFLEQKIFTSKKISLHKEYGLELCGFLRRDSISVHTVR